MVLEVVILHRELQPRRQGVLPAPLMDLHMDLDIEIITTMVGVQTFLCLEAPITHTTVLVLDNHIVAQASALCPCFAAASAAAEFAL